ncbi:MAG: YggS family pyridoxal phosphate-dependent enzyme [Phycisphaerales bacterium]|nr:YggS family pyridoxal phosphate-dependent enzyme [Phycisphaerales bacterium]
MVPPGTLKGRYESVKERIAAAARRAGRKPEHIVLVVVTKTASPEQVREIVSLGHRDLGESRVQQMVQRTAQMDEYLARLRELRGEAPEVRWHLIGSIQRNKVRKAIELSRLIHSVDSLRLAEEIHIQAARRSAPVDMLVEVNVSGETNKHGITLAAVRHVIRQLDTMVNIRVRGLMCMAPLGGGRDEARRVFARCYDLFDEIKSSGIGGEGFDLLSMGMSGDFEEAVECGANVVRVGTAIIGAPAPGSEAPGTHDHHEHSAEAG